MFEDSTFESTGRIHTHSRGWMLATSAFNGTILIALVLIPLIYPRALPQIMERFKVEAPTAPVVIDKPVVRVERTNLVRTEMRGGQIFAPTSIPSQHAVVREAVRGSVRVSGMVVEGLLLHRTLPAYPPIAVASRTQGTVVLQATISRSGTIENLHVASGPPMLQQAALNAVRSWRYKPYLLNGDPVEVETTVNVVFKLAD